MVIFLSVDVSYGDGFSFFSGRVCDIWGGELVVSFLSSASVTFFLFYFTSSCPPFFLF